MSSQITFFPTSIQKEEIQITDKEGKREKKVDEKLINGGRKIKKENEEGIL